MVLSIIVSALIGTAQAFLLYYLVSSAMKNKLKNALVFLCGKLALYGVSALLILTVGRDTLIPAAVSFGVVFTVLSFSLAFVSMRKK
ncbi:MAG: hypothetical protein IJS94_01760 [Clostridia bacterium]|nr:hypothetical protein [Clostridia bacterium]